MSYMQHKTLIHTVSLCLIAVTFSCLHFSEAAAGGGLRDEAPRRLHPLPFEPPDRLPAEHIILIILL